MEEEKIDRGIEGSIRNALERGEDLNKAAQSLVNAGYDVSEVERVARKYSSQEIQNQQNGEGVKKLPTSPPIVKKKSKKWLIILLIVFFMIIIIGAGFVVLFWKELFG